ncbi:biotin-requiring enzyme [Leptospira wolffii serovar Khorat str. Khorat-H2]|nr:biotin-requiring enzyme [Leptospira wolffii serovar Khorat str. Khorat-H2]
MGESMSRFYRLRLKEKEYAVELGDISSRIFDPENGWESILTHYSWTKEKEGHYSLPDGSLALVKSGKLYIHTRGKTFQFVLKGKDSVSGEAAQFEIKSPMPGKIIKMEVKKGDKVRKGQTLAVVEAMKMEHALKSGLDAEVEEILSSPGEIVSQDQMLLKLR